MSSTFNGILSLDIVASELFTAGNKRGPLPARILANARLATGTSDGQINKAWYKQYTGIAASTTTSIDLIGTLTDTSGDVINFDEVVLIFVRNLSASAVNYLEVGPHATNGFGVLASNRGVWKDVSDRSIIPADSTADVTGGGAFFLWYNVAGVAAAAGSTDILAIITGGSASAAAFEVLIMGRDN
jgi:hypothetical protein